MSPSALDVLTAAALLAHASLVPAGAGVVAALLVPRRGVLPDTGEQRAERLRHLARTGQLAGSTPSGHDAGTPRHPGSPVSQAGPSADLAPDPSADLATRSQRRWLLAAATCTAAAGIVHAAAGPHHAAEHPHFGLFFVLLAVLQFGWTARALLSPSRRLLQQAVALNVAVVALWATTRTVGLPFGLTAHHESVGAWDLAASTWEVGAALCCVVLLRSQGGRLGGPPLPRFAVPVLVVTSSAALLGLALTGAP